MTGKGNCDASTKGNVLAVYARVHGAESDWMLRTLCVVAPAWREEFFTLWAREHGAEASERVREAARGYYRRHLRGR